MVGTLTENHPPAPTPERLVLIASSETVGLASRHLTPPSRQSRLVGVVLVDTPPGPIELAAPILGTLDDLTRIVRTQAVDRAVICLPMAMTGLIARARQSAERAGLGTVFMPTREDVLRGACGQLVGTTAATTADDLAFLVGRAPRPIDRDIVSRVITGKRILITGAGGSIGAELARLVAAFDPAELALMDRSDNALFEIDRLIGTHFPGVSRKAVLNDVADADGTFRTLVRLKPQVVFHAAAHKHVPLMEDHPAAAVVNNFFGTRSVADSALAVGAERFVMVSTDKAVNPTSVMGATKRLAEIYIRSLNHNRRTRFTLVRFGNVLGSSCSVLPIWSKQVAEGGPITITHPDMTRFFMTIPEAAALVVQSAGATNGEVGTDPDVFVLDMGAPVKILDLARRFLQTLGLRAEGVDPGAAPGNGPTIKLRFTGIRPGEKLYEELAYTHEALIETKVPGVLAWKGPAPTQDEVTRIVADLSAVRLSPDPDTVLNTLRRHVPELGGSEASPAVHVNPTVIQTNLESAAA